MTLARQLSMEPFRPTKTTYKRLKFLLIRFRRVFPLLFTNFLTFMLASTYRSTNPPSLTDHPDRAKIVKPNFSQHFYQNFSTMLDPDLAPEFVAFAEPQRLPLGYAPRFDSDTVYSGVGAACVRLKPKLNKYMTYEVNGPCPDDEGLAQKLLLQGCEPLPRRRCRPAAPAEADEPLPLPESLWSLPPDNTVVWTAHRCKNYTCLANRERWQKEFDDCKDCFDLQGKERRRWIGGPTKGGDLAFTIDEVLATRTPGTVRIGLDIGGGAGTFAVRMRERNITIVTTSMNFNAPFNNFIASRGVIPLYITVSQRLPFFDNTLDIVHSMHVLSNWIPQTQLHFLLFDIYRVIRPGGLFWLDHFFCTGDQFEEVYRPMIESVGFVKLRWAVGSKNDKGPKREVYLSALLEKPLKNSW